MIGRRRLSLNRANSTTKASTVNKVIPATPDMHPHRTSEANTDVSVIHRLVYLFERLPLRIFIFLPFVRLSRSDRIFHGFLCRISFKRSRLLENCQVWSLSIRLNALESLIVELINFY